MKERKHYSKRICCRLQQLLDKLRFSDNAYKKKTIKSCLSAHEMNKHKLYFPMVHGSKSFTKEKQLLKEIRASQQEDSFDSFWTRLEERLIDSENTWYWHHLKQTWWLHQQVSLLILERDLVEDREGNIKELERRIEKLDIVLQKHGDETITNNTAKANFFTVSRKAWTSLGAKKPYRNKSSMLMMK
ncbi:uncharacterized protein LOC126785480 [Argentina anserina]|uniref:uncharacterized protein LOC126785480 n=1 Tax=Argentina anserina TaxID=57926 RepID=UPI0021766BC2|nr:uncharacterized protein LOC126785480 [Potentilla anserina]XP_050367140.1 uncharacterized protein LOC126785480 [Potentilla anserina]